MLESFFDMEKKTFHKIILNLPEWLPEYEAKISYQARGFGNIESRMKYVIELARKNVEEQTGGPFGAAVFESESGRLISSGVNIVVPSMSSVPHAETVALMLAQQSLGSFDLSANGLEPMQLVCSGQPCIQCFGNTWWSGVSSLVIGARGEDVESITGFEEGPLPKNWVELLEKRSAPLKPIEVKRDILRQEACDVLQLYIDSGGLVYNAGALSQEE